jgi:alpha-tubulin suppressor-like RCC1 family protein
MLLTSIARPTLRRMRTTALCVSLLVLGCSSGSTTGSQNTGGNTGNSSTTSAGLTRELLQRRKTSVSFGDSPAPALRSDSVYATIALGVDHGCLIASSGAFADQVLCWTSTSQAPLPVALPDRPVQLAAGAAHTCALTAGGDVWCWGSNSNGQLGADPAKVHASMTPLLVPRGDTVVYSQLAAGGNSTCILTPEQSAMCWGANGAGQLGIGTLTDTFQPTAVKLRAQIAHIAIAAEHACAAVDQAPVFSTWCWGNAADGKIGNTASSAPAQSGTSLYDEPLLILHAIGPYPVSHGYDGYEALRRMALGDRHSCGLTNYGIFYCWGDGSMGQLRFGQAQSGGYGGDTPTFGAADFGVPFAVGYFSNTAQIASGANHACVLDAQVLCWGDDPQAPADPSSASSLVEPPDGSAFTQIAAGGDDTCGATTSGELYCWGTGSPSPQKLPGGPYFDDLRGVTVQDQTPPDGTALVDCEPDLTVGMGPPPLSGYLFDFADVFSAAATTVTEVQLDLQVSLGTPFNEFELGVYAWRAGAYALLGRSRVANALDTNVLRFHFPGGLQVPPGPVTMQVTQRAGQLLYNDSHSIVNAGTAACPTSDPYQIPVRVYAK